MSINDPQLSERLSRIQTDWTLVQNAHGDSPAAAELGRRSLLQHYHGAVFRYICGAVGDPDAAEELSHDFAVRLLSGGFHRASPESGRFRNYVKTALINLVNDHFNKRKISPQQFGEKEQAPTAPAESLSPDRTFEDCLHDDLLNRAWDALKQANSGYHGVLLLRVENPDMASREMAELLSAQWESEVTSDWVRKSVERARRKFAELLVEEVHKTMEEPTDEQLAKELKELNLLAYCRSALENKSEKKK